jgi:Kef-type K+ transport system membrane component KefB
VSEDTGSLILVLALAGAAPLLAACVGRFHAGLVVPIAVVELVLGVIFGPHGLKLAHLNPSLSLLSELGLGFLFFFAGYEIEFERIKGPPLSLALEGWGISLILAYALAGLLYATGLVLSSILVGSALATTAIGTILPVLRDTDRLGGRFGSMMLAAGAIGELGPIMIMTVVLSADGKPASQTILLIVFGAITVVTAYAAAQGLKRHEGFLNRTLHTTGQVPVRLTVLLIFALVVIAFRLGLDVILGAFAAGLVLRLVLSDHEVHTWESKLEAVGFGVMIPFYFVVSGMKLDVHALAGSITDVLKVPLFLLLMLVVRGAPALLLYRKVLSSSERMGLALFSSTQLPLVVAITTIGVQEGEMRASTAAALVTAGALSVMIFPMLGLIAMNVTGAKQAPSLVLDEV